MNILQSDTRRRILRAKKLDAERVRNTRRFCVAVICALFVHLAFIMCIPRMAWPDFSSNGQRPILHMRIVKWIVPTPKPLLAPSTRWSRLDRSMLKEIRLTPADEQIVVLTARTENGKPSRAPHILRVEISPGIVHERSVMHIRVLTSSQANGVYIRFVVWQVGVPPIGAYRLSASDPDYPRHEYELFERDYTVPKIPLLYRGKTYQVEVIATGREGIASGAFVPIRVQ